ncbi:MAG: prephenate dehydrogenase [Lutibacter sp.]|jgi:prephenate dehydrogenase|nr:prephenate dehydrogenase [Lutibacter sp.]
MEKLVIIGLGLIGGSMALDLKKRGAFKVYGLDKDPEHLKKALALGIIDQEGTLSDVADASVVLIAVPVDKIAALSAEVLDRVSGETLVMDVGSVKAPICQALEKHSKRANFVAAHPLAGTEFSGPEAAITTLFDDKVSILCEADKADWRILDKAISLFKTLKMRIKMMDPVEHDRHIAYVSHLSHVSSFMLGKTVLEIEKNEQAIFDMASTGFASTVRLAKSAAQTWTPIFIQNRENIVKSLEEYIKNLSAFKSHIENGDKDQLTQTMDDTNYIKTVLKGIQQDT